MYLTCKSYHSVFRMFVVSLFLIVLTSRISSAQIEKQAFAQLQPQISEIKIKNIYWLTDTTKVAIEKTFEEKVKIPDSLTLQIILEPNSLKKYAPGDISFEFRWYRYGHTKRLISSTVVEKIKLPENPEKSNKPFVIQTKRKNLRTGRWEIEVFAYIDKKLLAYKEYTQFFIFLEP